MAIKIPNKSLGICGDIGVHLQRMTDEEALEEIKILRGFLDDKAAFLRLSKREQERVRDTQLTRVDESTEVALDT